MTSRFTELAVDCADPDRLADFWCAVLDYRVLDKHEGVVMIGPQPAPGDGDHSGPVPPVITFAQVPEGKTAKNRLHIDVSPSDRDQAAEVDHLIGLGARRTDVGQGADDSWVVLLDPEENEFCVLAGRRP